MDCILYHFSIQWPLNEIYNMAKQSPVHAHTDGQVNLASKGEASYSGTPRKEARDRTSNLRVASRPAQPPEPHAAPVK